MASFIDENTQFEGVDGKPLVNGKIYIGVQGQDPVLNPTNIFSDRALTIALANPQTLNSLGRSTNKIWIPGKYSLRVEDSAAVLHLVELDQGETQAVGTTKLSNVQGVDAITSLANPTITAYVDLQQYVFTAVGSNTVAVTMSIDGLVAKSIDGTSAAGTFSVDQLVSIYFNAATDSFAQGITPATNLASPGEIGGTTPDIVNSTNFIGPIGQTSANPVKGTTGEFTTSLKLAAGATVTEIETTLSSSAVKIPTSSAVNTKINTLPLDATVDQAALKTSTGDMVSSTSAINLFTGPGGEYGFWPTYKAANATARRLNIGPGNCTTTASASSFAMNTVAITTGFLQKFTVSNNVGTMTVRQRFVQASPPYNLGDGEVITFIFLIINNATRNIDLGWHAPDPVWANNGPTIIRPEYIRKGKAYRKVRMIDKTKEFQDPERYTFREQEITHAYKNSDMALIPHPFEGNDMTGRSILLIDPNDPILERMEEIRMAGEESAIEDVFCKDYIRFGNEHLAGRKTPHSSVMVVRPSWKNTA